MRNESGIDSDVGLVGWEGKGRAEVKVMLWLGVGHLGGNKMKAS